MARKKQQKSPAYQTAYYNLNNPLSYSGNTRFLRALPLRQRKSANKWLQGQRAYVMHKQVPRRFKRLKVVAGFQQQIQCDLIDVSGFSKFNSNVKFLLTAIDPFSKKAFVEPILKKDAISVTNAFEKIINRLGFKPVFFFSDQGKEFVNRTFQSLLSKYHIAFYTSKDATIKASIVERFNRTLMTRVHKFLTKENSSRYIHVLQDIIKNYNNTRHNSTGLAPNQIDHHNKELVWLRLHQPTSQEKKKKSDSKKEIPC